MTLFNIVFDKKWHFKYKSDKALDLNFLYERPHITSVIEYSLNISC